MNRNLLISGGFIAAAGTLLRAGSQHVLHVWLKSFSAAIVCLYLRGNYQALHSLSVSVIFPLV